MTSSEEKRPRRRRRGLFWLAGLLLVAFGLYSAGWFWAAERVRSEAARTITALNVRGIQAECANLTVSGYPLRFNVTFPTPSLKPSPPFVSSSYSPERKRRVTLLFVFVSMTRTTLPRSETTTSTSSLWVSMTNSPLSVWMR